MARTKGSRGKQRLGIKLTIVSISVGGGATRSPGWCRHGGDDVLHDKAIPANPRANVDCREID